MTKKEKNMVLIISVIVVALVIFAIIASVLYFNTDMFKSKGDLFVKYIIGNIENTNNITNGENINEFNSKLGESKYTSNSDIKIKCTENVGEVSEDSKNSINDFNISINGKTDKSSNYDYKDIKISNQNEEKMQIEYVKDNDTYGVKFPELFQQYILADNSNLKELFENIGYEDSSKIPDKIEINDDIFSYINFSSDEVSQLKEKYTNLLQKEVSAKNISKGSNQIIQIGEQKVKASSYTLTLTKEQMNNIFLKVLEEIKQDDIILNKLGNISDLEDIYYTTTKNSNAENLKTKFVDDIEELIRKISSTNIGNDATKITVYQSNKNTVKTVIEYTGYQISLDILNQNNTKYIELNIQNDNTSSTKTIVYKEDSGNNILEITNNIDGDINKTTINNDINIEENKGNRDLTYTFEGNNNKVEVTCKKNIEFVDKLDKENTSQNSIKLNELGSENLTNITERIKASVLEKINSIFSDENKQDLDKILQIIGIKKQQQKIESEGTSEIEKNRFNSKYEILQGEDLESTRIIDLIDVAKDDMTNLEVVSGTKLKIQLEKNKGNSEMVDKLTNFVKAEQNARNKYKVSVEYDDETGLVKDIVMEIAEE